MIVQMVTIQKILHDDFFRFSSDYDHSQLKKSIQLSGIHSPLLVHPSEGGYRLLSGFNRFKVAEELGLKKIPIVLKNDSFPLTEVFYSVLADHLTTHSLNLVEKARVLGICRKLDVSEEQILNQFLLLMDLPQNPSTIKKLESILKFSESLQFYIEKVDLSLKKIRLFQSLSMEEQSIIAGLGHNLHIRGFELTELVNFVREIAKRESLTFYDILKAKPITNSMKSEKLTRAQKLSSIKRILFERRYPKLTFWNSNLKNMVREMKLPPSMQLLWDRNLEKPGILLQINLTSVDALREITDCFSRKETIEIFEKLLEIV